MCIDDNHKDSYLLDYYNTKYSCEQWRWYSSLSLALFCLWLVCGTGRESQSQSMGDHLEELGASTVKWTPLDPCLDLSESDPKLYTNFEFYAIEIHKHLENM